MKRLLTALLILSIHLTLNAQIYNTAMRIEYDVYYIKSNDTIKSMLYLECTGNKWSFQNKSIDDSWTIRWIQQDSKTGEDYITETGIKETSDKLFLHPPRSKEYAILEFCPFPLIHYPLEIGNNWEWELENIPEIYYRALHNPTKQKISVRNKYKITKKISWFYKKANKYIECFKVESIGETSIGTTKLTFYFSPQYGFIYLNFETLNKDRFILKFKEQTVSFKFQNKSNRLINPFN